MQVLQEIDRMTRHNALVAAITGIALISGIAAGPAAAESPPQPNYPKVLRRMVDAGEIQVVKQFPTDKPGLTGYRVKRDGYQTVVYGEDDYLMLGPLYGPKGTNLSKRYKRQHQSRPDVAQTIDGLDSEHLITEGAADAPALYVFLDPNCIFCHKLYQQTAPLVKQGKLRIHWILVGVLGSSSIGRAATILSADDPVGMLAQDEAGFDVANEQGGVTPKKPDDKIANVLDRHRDAMFNVGGRGTPVVLFQNPDGHWQARQGLPPVGWLDHYAQD
ncbi:MAG: thiol:disulfide interchange protein DsbG [Xanthomonadales bacterium]|nr:thiol:disulfide interchange protein DsbG [Xanthomonadales bacterium]|tara:strand:- start:623 stop:1444 length:822 start_codon:yes stop_codon:yes gene_type:complete